MEVGTIAGQNLPQGALLKFHTPAMQLGDNDHIWTIGELVDAALNGANQETPGRKVEGKTWLASQGGKALILLKADKKSVSCVDFSGVLTRTAPAP